MPRRATYPIVGVLAALLVGLLVYKYGDTTGGLDTDDPVEVGLARGWRQIDDVQLPAIGTRLRGIKGAPDGLPLEGAYLVNFWATTCGPCKVEMPWLEQLHAEQGVTVVGVTRDNIIENAERFLDRRGVTYPNLSDEFGDFMFALGHVIPPSALPATILVEDGRITWARTGPFESYADLEETVTERLS